MGSDSSYRFNRLNISLGSLCSPTFTVLSRDDHDTGIGEIRKLANNFRSCTSTGLRRKSFSMDTLERNAITDCFDRWNSCTNLFTSFINEGTRHIIFKERITAYKVLSNEKLDAIRGREFLVKTL